MERLPEPELMDDVDQATAYAEADFSVPHGRLIEILAETYPGIEFSGDILDIGCGPGDVTFRVARRYPRARITAVDGAAPMIQLAERRKTRHPSAARIEFLQCVLPTKAIPRKVYELILSSSFLHHLHSPQVLWQAIAEHAGPGTRVFVADLCRPPSEAEAKQIVETDAGDEPDILKRDYYNSLLAAFTPEEVEQQLARAGLGGLRVYVDRYVLISGQFAA